MLTWGRWAICRRISVGFVREIDSAFSPQCPVLFGCCFSSIGSPAMRADVAEAIACS